MKRLLLLLPLLWAIPSFGQTQISSGPVNPAFCTPGAFFFNSTTVQYVQCGPANTWTVIPSGGGLTNVTSLPALCTPGVTAPVNLTVAPYGIYFCSATNTWSASGLTPAGNAGDLQMNNGASALAASAINDNGTIITVAEPTNINGDIRAKGPNPYIDIRAYGARTCNPSSTPCGNGLVATINSGSSTATINSASTFINGDGVVIYNAGPTASVTSAPTGLTVVPSLATAGTGTGIVSASAAGGTTRCYKVIARDTGGGYTPASSETCINTGQTLGIDQVTLTSCSRSGIRVTCTTSGSHPLNVGAGGNQLGEVYINSTSDPSFQGFYQVDTAVDSTHFTIKSPTQNTAQGSTTSTTGGAAWFYVCDHVTWGAVTNAWLYYIYEGASGAETLVGVSRPSGNASTGNTDTEFDYFGTFLQGNWTFPPWIPTTPPISGANDNLSTTISSGAGTTTLTLAGTAGASVVNSGIRLDASVAIASAAAAASPIAPLYIPNDPSGNPFVINNFADLRPYQLAIYQSGSLFLNETLAIGYNSAPIGTVRWTGAQNTAYNTATSNGWGPLPSVAVKEATPGVYDGGGNAITIDGLDFNSPDTNNALLFLVDGKGGAFNNNFIHDTFGTSTSTSDYNGYGLILRNMSGVFLDKISWGNGANADGQGHNTPFYCNLCGDVHIKSAYNVHKGYIMSASSNGTLSIDEDHYNGGGTPLVTTYGVNSVILSADGGIIMDTVGHPCVAMLFGNGSVTNNGCQPSGTSFTSPSVTGPQVQSIGGGALYNNSLISYGAVGFRESDGASVISNIIKGPGSYAASSLDSMFIGSAIPSTPTCSVSSGGSISNGNWTFIVQPGWSGNAFEGVASAASSTCTTTTGNQTITVNISTVAGNPFRYQVFASNGGGYGFACTITPPSTSCVMTSISISSTLLNSAAPVGGPTMLMPGTNGVLAPQFIISAPTGATNITSVATANRLVSFPDASGTVCLTSSCGGLPAGSTNSTQYNAGSGLFGGNGPGLTGQLWTSAGSSSAPNMQSPGIPDGNSGAAVTTTPYTIQCDSGSALVDRAHILRFQSGAAAVTVPLSTASGCNSNFVVVVVDDGAGTLTFSRTSTDTFSIFDGGTNTDSATSFTLTNGQYATLSQGATGIWEVRKTIGNVSGQTNANTVPLCGATTTTCTAQSSITDNGTTVVTTESLAAQGTISGQNLYSPNTWLGRQHTGLPTTTGLTTIYNSSLFDTFPGITTYGPSNSYLVASFMHSAVGDPNTDGVIEYTTSTDGGQTWSTPATIFSAPASFHEQDSNLVTLRRDGSLLLTGFVESNSGSPAQGQCFVIRGTWAGSTITWGSPTYLGPAFASTPNGDGFCTDKALELQNGNLLLTVYAEQSGGTHYSTGVYTGTWSGNTLTWSGSATLIAAGTSAEQYDETGIVQSPNGTILAMIRHDVSAGTIGYSQSTSTNNGSTWSGLTQTLTCSSAAPNCGRPAMGINPAGKIVMASVIAGSTYVSSYVSSDNGGSTWSSPVQYGGLNEYASMVWVGSGTWAVASGIATVLSTTASLQLNFFYDGSGGGYATPIQQLGQQVVSGSSTTNISFTNIPPSYSKIVLDIVAADSSAANIEGLTCQINGDTTSGDYAGYNWQGGVSSSGAASAVTGTSNGLGCGAIPGATSPSNSTGIVEVTIMNYASTTFTKTIQGMAYTQSTNSTLGSMIMSNYFGQWNSTAAVTTLKIIDGSGGHLVAGSTFTLYGVQ